MNAPAQARPVDHGVRPAASQGTADALAAFSSLPTPANAIRLAIADHKATTRGPGFIDWQFVRALERAATVLEGNTPVSE
jgi:hypothetical protein